jgi:transketolase
VEKDVASGLDDGDAVARGVGDHGRIVSIEHYGASAEYARIYTEFGITAQAVADAARDSVAVVTA